MEFYGRHARDGNRHSANSRDDMTDANDRAPLLVFEVRNGKYTHQSVCNVYMYIRQKPGNSRVHPELPKIRLDHVITHDPKSNATISALSPSPGSTHCRSRTLRQAVPSAGKPLSGSADSPPRTRR